MTPQDVRECLEGIASADDFAYESDAITEEWSQAPNAIEAIEPVLLFMESHPSLDYGTPGSLVHFVEKFYGSGYEQKLIDSINRKPTSHTLWMLNRLINGAKSPGERQQLTEMMRKVSDDPKADPEAREAAKFFLE